MPSWHALLHEWCVAPAPLPSTKSAGRSPKCHRWWSIRWAVQAPEAKRNRSQKRCRTWLCFWTFLDYYNTWKNVSPKLQHVSKLLRLTGKQTGPVLLPLAGSGSTWGSEAKWIAPHVLRLLPGMVSSLPPSPRWRWSAVASGEATTRIPSKQKRIPHTKQPAVQTQDKTISAFQSQYVCQPRSCLLGTTIFGTQKLLQG